MTVPPTALATNLQEFNENRRQLFEELALPLRNDLYQRALNMKRNPIDAEDLVQDVYLRAFRFFNQFQHGTNFKAWIFAILRNAFVDGYRKSKNQPFAIDHDLIEHSVADRWQEKEHETHVGSCDEVAIKNMFDDRLQGALHSLPPDFCRAFLLAKIGDLSYEEVAKVMDCPLGTVRSRLSRARRLLREYLQSRVA